MSWPQIIAISPDGNRAYVVEVRLHPPDKVQEFETIVQMPEGSKLRAVDLAQTTKPKIIETVDIGRNPEHISISPNGKFLAINLEEPGQDLLMMALNSDGTLGTRSYAPIPTDGTRMDNRAAIWHQDGPT